MWPVFERLFGRRPAGDGWDLRIEHKGRDGPIIYLEGPNRIDFDFELGDGGTIYCPPSAEWDQRLPWAAGRRSLIVKRVAAEFVRREFPRFTFEIGGTVLRPRLGTDGGQLLELDPDQSDDIIVIRKKSI
jgi:hypothetical protein